MNVTLFYDLLLLKNLTLVQFIKRIYRINISHGLIMIIEYKNVFSYKKSTLWLAIEL